MASVKSKKKSNGMIIFMLALLAVYCVITLAMIVLFEYYTISTSEGSIIFSMSMSWQIILFAAELVTIIIQLVCSVKVMKNKNIKTCNVIKYTGIVAAAAAFITVIILAFSQGAVINPTVVFLVYALMITVVRAVILPLIVQRYISP